MLRQHIQKYLKGWRGVGCVIHSDSLGSPIKLFNRRIKRWNITGTVLLFWRGVFSLGWSCVLRAKQFQLWNRIFLLDALNFSFSHSPNRFASWITISFYTNFNRLPFVGWVGSKEKRKKKKKGNKRFNFLTFSLQQFDFIPFSALSDLRVLILSEDFTPLSITGGLSSTKSDGCKIRSISLLLWPIDAIAVFSVSFKWNRG